MPVAHSELGREMLETESQLGRQWSNGTARVRGALYNFRVFGATGATQEASPERLLEKTIDFRRLQFIDLHYVVIVDPRDMSSSELQQWASCNIF